MVRETICPPQGRESWTPWWFIFPGITGAVVWVPWELAGQWLALFFICVDWRAYWGLALGDYVHGQAASAKPLRQAHERVPGTTLEFCWYSRVFVE
jgi:hypothetical protein